MLKTNKKYFFVFKFPFFCVLFFQGFCQLVYRRNKPSHIHPKMGRLAKVYFALLIVKYILFFLQIMDPALILWERFVHKSISALGILTQNHDSPTFSYDSCACSYDIPTCNYDSPTCNCDSCACSYDSPTCSCDSRGCSYDSPACNCDSRACSCDSCACS